MKKSISIFLSFFLLGSYAAAKQDLTPKGECSQEIHHTYYSLCYEGDHRQASWVKYKLTPKMLKGSQQRAHHFTVDPNIEDPVMDDDYAGTGFDRGHLVPAADMRLNKKMVKESFFMTNVSPQNPSFNRGIWKRMEALLRKKVAKWGEAHIITAPVLENNLDALEAGVSIPEWYYKVAYFPKQKIMVAFLVQNRAFTGAEPSEFQVSLDEIEDVTGLDFFTQLPNQLEKDLESEIVEL